MHLQQAVQFIRLSRGYVIQFDMACIQAAFQLSILIQHPGDAAGHTRGKVVAHRPQHGHPSAGHVFAAVVAHALNNRPCAGISHGETLARHACHKGISARRAVQRHVADQGIFLFPDAVRRRAYRQRAAGQTLAQVVVCHAVERDLLTAGQERAETLSAAALGLDMPFTLQHRAESPVGGHQMHMVLIQPRVCPFRQAEIMFRRRLEMGVPGKAGQVGKIHRCAVLHRQQVAAAHQFVHGARAELRHDLPHLFRDKEHEPLHIFRFSLETPAQLGILGRDAEGAGTQLAHAHHPAAHGYQRGSRKAELFCAQQQRHHDVVAGHKLAVGFQRHRLSQPVAAEHLVRFRQADLPGQARVMHAAHGCRAGAAFPAGNQDAAGAGLGHAAGNSAHARGRHQFHGDLRVLVGALQVIDQFRQVLNRIDIVMRRRRNQGDPRC